MDRRRFLTSLAAMGVQLPAAALASSAVPSTEDDAVAGLAGTSWWVPVLRCWKEGSPSPALEALCDALDVPQVFDCTRADVAVARLLLGGIQRALPAWSTVFDGRIVSARPVYPTRLDGAPVFEPTHLATINWADSGPGFSWPEAYHVTTVPELGMHVVTASRDSEDLMGCTDHALGWVSIDVSPLEAATALMRANWLRQAGECEQQAWESAIEEGLLGESELLMLRDEVWQEADFEDDDAEVRLG